MLRNKAWMIHNLPKNSISIKHNVRMEDGTEFRAVELLSYSPIEIKFRIRKLSKPSSRLVHYGKFGILLHHSVKSFKKGFYDFSVQGNILVVHMDRPYKVMSNYNRIKEMYVDKGMTMHQISLVEGVTKQAIQLRMANLGIESRPRGGGVRDSTIRLRDRIKNLHNQGLTMTRIAEELKVSYCTVQSNSKKMGLIRNGRGTSTSKHWDSWLRLYDSGWSAREIAIQFSTTTTTVTRFLKKKRNLRPRKLTQDEIEKTKSMYESGSSFEEIGVHFDITVAAVKLRLSHNCGIVLPKGRRKRDTRSNVRPAPTETKLPPVVE